MHFQTFRMLVCYGSFLLKNDSTIPNHSFILTLINLSHDYAKAVPEIRKEFINFIEKFPIDLSYFKELEDKLNTIHENDTPEIIKKDEENIYLQFVRLKKLWKGRNLTAGDIAAAKKTADEITAASEEFNDQIMGFEKIASDQLVNMLIAQCNSYKTAAMTLGGVIQSQQQANISILLSTSEEKQTHNSSINKL